MFGKVGFVLAALIATSLGKVTESVNNAEPVNIEPVNTEPVNTEPVNTEPVNNIQWVPPSTEQFPQNHKIVLMLNCSSLTGNKIELIDTEFRAIERPCRLRAPEVLLKNNLFWSSESNFEILADNVTIEHNGFFGSEQDHRISAYEVKMIDNVYIGQHQIHEIYGPNIMKSRNVYDGNFQVHHITGRNIMENKEIIRGMYWSHRKSPMIQIVPGKGSGAIKKFVTLPMNVIETGNNFGGIHRNKLPSGSGLRHLLNGLKNRRNPNAPIVRQIVDLYDAPLSR
ncbi:GSCOCT00013044001.2-RA-CDS [Cotesia congregata]|uniref:Cc_ep1.4_5.5 n=2 Tax=root TaxID=1 RepID=S6D4P1_COTCN|nr:hypothetical protein CcBV_5.5 [Bracoviriform congregatae]CAD6243360.1 GSCOCT00013044001.2-RA-CDS [Cotesia congregata]CAG17411.1 hypothetical protein CcBV_5.5 [Bracoviriform congregatae]CAG5092350.1 cc_ep1.4_5.5 [Cotesia congregata]CCQ71100.1 hypothetical protein EP1-like4 [Cotesia congregata]